MLRLGTPRDDPRRVRGYSLDSHGRPGLRSVAILTAYYGDNLDTLKRYVEDESVDLVYLDPPFKSDQNYNVLFAEQDGSRSAAPRPCLSVRSSRITTVGIRLFKD